MLWNFKELEKMYDWKAEEEKALLRCYSERGFEEWQWIVDTDTRKKAFHPNSCLICIVLTFKYIPSAKANKRKERENNLIVWYFTAATQWECVRAQMVKVNQLSLNLVPLPFLSECTIKLYFVHLFFVLC